MRDGAISLLSYSIQILLPKKGQETLHPNPGGAHLLATNKAPGQMIRIVVLAVAPSKSFVYPKNRKKTKTSIQILVGPTLFKKKKVRPSRYEVSYMFLNGPFSYEESALV